MDAREMADRETERARIVLRALGVKPTLEAVDIVLKSWTYTRADERKLYEALRKRNSHN